MDPGGHSFKPRYPLNPKPTFSRAASSFLMRASAAFSSFSVTDSWVMRCCSSPSCALSSSSLFAGRSPYSALKSACGFQPFRSRLTKDDLGA